MTRFLPNWSKRQKSAKGSLQSGFIPSQLLSQSSRWGIDPQRPYAIYTPIDQEGKSLPLLLYLAPWTHVGGASAFAQEAFKESLCARIDRLIAEAQIPPVRVASINLYTVFGGSQFIDSNAVGLHARFLVEEALPYLVSTYPVDKSRVMVMGRSSGGYGALRLAMDFPGVFSDVMCFSGDMGFEASLLPDLLTIAKKMENLPQGLASFFANIDKKEKLSRGDTHLLMLLGLCTFYSPDESEEFGFSLPIDPKSGVLNKSVWQRWLEHDPVYRLQKRPESAQNLSQLKTLYLDCGRFDQYGLVYGLRQFREELNRQGLLSSPQVLVEEFDDDHSSTDYRFDRGLTACFRS